MRWSQIEFAGLKRLKYNFSLYGGVKLLAVDDVYPDKNNIANGSYPIVSNFYAVYDKANDNKNVRPLIQWMLSGDGQRIIEETGYVPVH